MADVHASQAPWATGASEACGPVAGSSPNWGTANMQDKGRSHATGHKSEFNGVNGWYNGGQQGGEQRAARRVLEGPTGTSYAEPVVQGAHPSYYTRRANGDDPSGFRRSLRSIPEPPQIQKPQGRRAIPEPFGPPPHISSMAPAPSDVLYREAKHAAEPPLPHLGRPSGITGLRETDSELSYERAMGRKVRVGQETYSGAGRAGDMSLRYGPTHRPEDDPTFFKSLKDSPTFLRFCNTLPAKPVLSPHERRATSLRRVHESEIDRERQLVASLQLPDAEEST